MAYSDYQIPVFTGINDVPAAPTENTGCNGSFLIDKINNICINLDTDIANIQASLINQDTDIANIQASLINQAVINSLASQVSQLTEIDIPDIQSNLNSIQLELNNKPNIPSEFEFSTYDGLGTIQYLGNQLEIKKGDATIDVLSDTIRINSISFEKRLNDNFGYDYVIAAPYGDNLIIDSPLRVDKIYGIDGLQVLTNQQPAISNLEVNETTANIIERINTILAMLRNHGLIAAF
jgi:hypothetical protein